MVAPTSDYRPLLSGGLWLAGTAAIVAALYAVGGGSSIAAALAFDYVLVTVAAWAARDIHRKRDFPAPAVESPEPVDAPSSTPAIDPARAAVQFQSSVLGAIAVIIGLLAGLQLLQLTPTEVRMADDDTVIGIICLAGTFVWLVLARAFQSIPRNDLPEVTPLMSAFREGQWTTLIAAAGLLGAPLHPLIVYWVTRILLVWIVIVCGEAILRIGVLMLVPAEDHHPPVAPIQSLLREAIFAAANPVSSLVRTFEDRFGVSVRSSWAIAFVKNATLPLMIMLIVLGWALTSLAIVETHQMAVREHFGRVVGSPLKPGLHFMLPWPFGRMKAFPVKTVQQLPIGFVEAEDDAEMTNRDRPRALLWTKPHAKEEFALALGDGSELVAVNALV